MKKVILQLGSTEECRRAGRTLEALSGVMVTNTQGNTLVVHCGERMKSGTLVQKLEEQGCRVSIGDVPPQYF